jgi:hypothetical protein
MYDDIEGTSQLSPGSRRNVWKSTNLYVQSNGTIMEVKIKRKIEKKGDENTYYMEVRTDDSEFTKILVEKSYAEFLDLEKLVCDHAHRQALYYNDNLLTINDS